MIYILTSTETILKAEVRSQESRVGDENVKGVLSLMLKQTLTTTAFTEQQSYLQASATAAYVSLNKLDQRMRYRASVNLVACNNHTFNFNQGSSSSGLGYALACFYAWWKSDFSTENSLQDPIFATGAVLTSGHINKIGQITEKIESLCRYIEVSKPIINRFYFCYPSDNEAEIPQTLKDRLLELGGVLVSSNRLQETLGALLGKAYDGDPLGRWQPFKGLNSFDYEDNVRFFGRDKDVERIYNDLEHNNGLLIVSGASGTGKSSLIKAGLIPKLETEYGHLYWASCTPNSLRDSQGILAFIFEQLIKAWDITDKNLTEIKTLFNISSEDGIEFFTQQINSQTNKCLVYLDQYEEVFIQSERNNDQIAIELSVIDSLAKSLSPLSIILALRNEYLGRLLDSQALRSPIISNVASKLTYEEWRAIVHDQAQFSGINFEQSDNNKQSLDTVIIEEAIQIPFALPMVSFLLEQLYLKALEENPLTIKLLYTHYLELGGITGVMVSRASNIIKTNNPSEILLSSFFDFFVGINSDKKPFPKKVSVINFEKSEQSFQKFVNKFIDAYLIISIENDGLNIKLVNQSLLTEWDLFNNWFSDNKGYLIWEHAVKDRFIEWKIVRDLRLNRTEKISNKKFKTNPFEEIKKGMEDYKIESRHKNYIINDISQILEVQKYLMNGRVLDKDFKKYLNEAIYSKLIRMFIIVIFFIIVF